MGDSPLQLVSKIGHQLARLSRPNKDLLVKSLREAANALSQIEQPLAVEPPSKKKAAQEAKNSINTLTKSIIKHGLLRHPDKDVKLLVGVCVSDIFRILAPDPPFEDNSLRGVFELFMSMFEELGDTASPCFSRRVKVLETVARCRCCVIMLDIGCNDLVVKMFDVFFSVVREHHQQSLINNMLSIMTHILSEEASPSLVDMILRNLVKEGETTSSAASQLAGSVIQTCAEKLEPIVCGFLTSCFLDRDSVETELKELYHEILFKLFQCAPQMLLAVIPCLTQELMIDQVDVRIKAVNLVGKLISLPGHQVAQKYRNLFMEFKNRFSDKSVEVRLSAIQCSKSCYMASPSGNESLELLSALEGRLLDIDDRVRTQAVVVICDLARSNLKSFPSDVMSSAMQRLRDKKISVRKKALQKLMELYRDYCNKCPEGHMTTCDFFEQIPCKVLMLCYDKDCKEFRSQNLEGVLAEDLFPLPLSVEERTKHWIHLFSLFTPLHEKALNSILSQKRRLQTEMQIYLAIRKKEKDISPEQIQKRLRNSFVKMSAFFQDPSKAEECFHKLNELKDSKIFSALEQLLGERTIEKARTTRDNFLKMIGDKHPHSELLQALSTKCLFNIFGSENVRCIIDHLSSSESPTEHFEVASTKLLVTIVNNFPVLLRGSEEQYLELLKRNKTNDTLIQALAKAGPYVSIKFSDFYPLLKEVCMKGTRIQSKHAVSAIASLVDSSEQLIFSKLCKELVHSLHGGWNVPTLLQSLGGIAQHCVSAFEEQYGEVEECDASSSSHGTSECCDSCKLKIYGLKVLVKSFLPHRGSLVEGKVHEILDILLKILQPGNAFDGIVSCTYDKHHLRLAAAKSVLRLSRRWDLHISPDIFRFTVLIAKDPSFSIRKSFLAKTFKMLKERAIPTRFACAFALAASDCCKDLQDAALHYMEEYVKEYTKDVRTSQVFVEKEGLHTANPAYIVVFLIHILAHDIGFPEEDCQDEEEYARFLRPLFWVVQVLVNLSIAHCDMDLISGSASYLLSIFRAIRKAEDAVHAEGTHKLQVLAEIGLSFVKALNHNSISSSRAPAVILLPSSLYRVCLVKKCDQANVNSSTPFAVEGRFFKRVIQILESQTAMDSSTLSRHGRNFEEDSTMSIAVKCGRWKSASHEHDSSTVRPEMQKIGSSYNCMGHMRKRALSQDNSAMKPCLTESQASILKAQRIASSKENVGASDGCSAESSKCSKFKELHSENRVLIGKRIKLLSLVDRCFHSGTVVDFDSRYNTHKICYDSGDIELLSLDSESWEAIDDSSLMGKDIVSAEDSSPQYYNSSDPVGSSFSCNPAEISHGMSSLCVKGKQGKKVLLDTSASEVTNVAENAMAPRTRRRKA